jgi:hypothetical protein
VSSLRSLRLLLFFTTEGTEFFLTPAVYFNSQSPTFST